HEALSHWSKGGGLPDTATLGIKFRQAKDKVAGGWVLRAGDAAGDARHSKVATWRVERVGEEPGPKSAGGDPKTAGDPPASPAGSDSEFPRENVNQKWFAGDGGGCADSTQVRENQAHVAYGERPCDPPPSPAEGASGSDDASGNGTPTESISSAAGPSGP